MTVIPLLAILPPPLIPPLQGDLTVNLPSEGETFADCLAALTPVKVVGEEKASPSLDLDDTQELEGEDVSSSEAPLDVVLPRADQVHKVVHMPLPSGAPQVDMAQNDEGAFNISPAATGVEGDQPIGHILSPPQNADALQGVAPAVALVDPMNRLRATAVNSVTEDQSSPHIDDADIGPEQRISVPASSSLRDLKRPSNEAAGQPATDMVERDKPRPTQPVVSDVSLSPEPSSRLGTGDPVKPFSLQMASPPQSHVQMETVARISRQIVQGAENGTEIRLDPPELGSLRFLVSTTDQGVTIRLQADNPDTAELLRRHMDLLTVELRQAGYAGVDVSIDRRQQGGRHMADRPDGPVVDDLQVVLAPPAAITSGGLDLRL